MHFDLHRVRENVRSASTEDLLDRATVYRAGLEPAAVPVILEELRTRGVSAEAIIAYEGARQPVLYDPSGTARTCHHCPRPAVTRDWGWHRVFGLIPLFPRPFYLCEHHGLAKVCDDRETESDCGARSGTD
jgi:hypothetical protein